MSAELYPVELPFVGRSKEIAHLVSLLEETKNGHGSIVFITGAVGIGKSRLLEIIENYAISEDFRVVKAQGLNENSVPFLPFKDAFREIEKAKSQSAMPLAIGLIEGDKNIETIDINRERYRIYEYYLQKIRSFLETAPLLIVIDDLHWVDQESLNLLLYLSKFVNEERFSIFCAYPDETIVGKKSRALQNLLDKIIGTKGVQTLRLEPLKIEETAVLLEALLQTWKIPSELLKVIYEKSEGNPLYIEELAHAVLAKGFYEPRTRKIKRDLGELAIPENLANLVKSRFEVLPENAKKLLSAASIFGRRFSYAHLKKLTAMSDEELLSSLELLVQNNFIAEEKGLEDYYRFTHNIFYEVSYATQTGLRRKMMHEKVASLLEEELAKEENEELTNAVAMHYWVACNYPKCAQYSLVLAKKMLEKFAVEDAIAHAKRAKECLEMANIEDHKARVELYTILGEASIILAAWENAVEALIELRRLVKDEPELEIDVLLKLAFVEQKRGNPHQALNLLSEAAEIAKEVGLTRDLGRIYRSMGFVYEKRGDYLAAQSYYIKSLEICQAEEDEIEKAEVYHRYGTNLYMMGKAKEAEEYLQKCAEIRKKYNLLRPLANTYNNLGAIYATQGNNDKAIEYYTMAKEIFEKTNDVTGSAFIYNNLGVLYHDAGNWEKAMEYYRKDYETNRKLGNKWEYLVSASNIGGLYKDMEDYEKAKEFYKITLSLADELGERMVSLKVLANLALVYAQTGEIAEAENCIQRAMIGAAESISPEVQGTVYLCLGILRRMQKRYDEAREAFNRAMVIYKEMNAPADIATLNLEIGILEKELGRFERAKELFQNALDYFEKTKAMKMIEKVKKEMG